MTPQASRREFLRADILRQDVPRPPGARPDGFRTACTECGDCALACPQAIICSDGEGAVRLDLSQRGCTFCGDCVRACETGALDAARMAERPWIAAVSPGCLSLNGVACRICDDSCDARAIRFRLEVGGRARPLVDETACTGCGACISTCPAAALSLTRRPAVTADAMEASR